MIRRIVVFDEEKCNGCGACARACHESAIGIVNGKAKLLRDDYCDGMGDCLPECPMDAIRFEEREALAYDEEAVKANQEKQAAFAKVLASRTIPTVSGCQPTLSLKQAAPIAGEEITSQLQNWPPQIKLAPIKAPYYQQAGLLIAADCTAFSYGDFHRRFMQGRVTLFGCPKLDAIDYSEKLTEIFLNNSFTEILLVRMQVPCCGGLERAVKTALENSGRNIPLKTIVVSIEGKIVSEA